MSDDVKHGDDDLDLDLDGDDQGTEADDVSTDDGKTTSQEDESTDLDLEEKETSKGNSDAARDAQAKAWANKILAGEKSFDDLPKDKKWLVPFITERVDAYRSTKKTAPSEDLDALLEAKLKQREDDRQFKDLEAQIRSLGLPQSQLREVNAEYKALKAEGLSPLKALQSAAKIARVEFDDTASRRRSLSTPKVGGGVKEARSIADVDVNSLSDDDLYKMVSSMQGH